MNAHLLRLFRTAPVVWLLAGLLGCGPGVGGTGTGAAPDPASFGASAESVCTAPFAGALQCPVGAGAPGTANVLKGTDVVHFADVAAGGNVAASIDGNVVQFTARCAALAFTGTWGVLVGEGRFYGYAAAGAGAQTLPATLVVQVAGNSGLDLQVTLRDAAGGPLHGPVTLQRVSAPVANPAACP